MESLLTIAPMLATAAYIVSSLLFILSLAGLSKHESSKGGIVYAIQEQLNLPIKLVGVGEGIDDFAFFDPQEFATGLVG